MMKMRIRVGILVALIIGIGVWVQPTEAANGRIIGNYHVKYADAECTQIRAITVDHEVTGHTIGDDNLLDFYYLLIKAPSGTPILSVRLHVFIDNTTSGPFDLVPAGSYPFVESGTYTAYLLDIWQRTIDPVLSPQELQETWNDGNAFEKASGTFQLDSIVNDGWYNAATGLWEDCPVDEDSGGGSVGGGVDNTNQPGYTDGRFQHDRLVVYNELGPDGQPALHIYCVDEGSHGHLAQTLTLDQSLETLQRARKSAEQANQDQRLEIGSLIELDHVEDSSCSDRYSIRIYVVTVLSPERAIQWFEIRMTDHVEHKMHIMVFEMIPLSRDDVGMRTIDLN